MKRIFFIAILFIAAVSINAQNSFEQFDFLIGNWQGVESGIPGNGIGFRTYVYDLNKNFIVEKNQSTFPKTDKKPMGEVHRDFGVISYNSNDSTIVFRQFHTEGFTNIFVLNKELSTSHKFVFITREIENNHGNWVAKFTITKISETEFSETFEIAMDGIKFNQILNNNFKKVN